MITPERVLETLGRFHITEEQLSEWEAELGLEIPLDKFGNKAYSPLHINLFKNIKKHLTLGRSLSEIKRLVVLPSQSQAVTAAEQAEQTIAQESVLAVVGSASLETERHMMYTQNQALETGFKNTLSQRLLQELRPVTPNMASASQAQPFSITDKALPGNTQPSLPSLSNRTKRRLKRFASTPVRITSSSISNQQGANAGLLVLIDRLIEEKDELQSKVLDIEKQKVHLHQANDLFQRRVKELSQEIESLQEQLRARENFKLITEKSRLQKQLIEAEQRQAAAEKTLSKLTSEIHQLKESLASRIHPKAFVGNWLEEAELMEVAFDNFGINIESRRNRMFRITHPPERFFGHTAIIDTTYDYQTNTLWKRTETLVLNIIHENRLEGELTADYILDGTLVAKAIYRVKCHRNGVKTN